jgi:hypothetical protein
VKKASQIKTQELCFDSVKSKNALARLSKTGGAAHHRV